jgi:hypothetical protein
VDRNHDEQGLPIRPLPDGPDIRNAGAADAKAVATVPDDARRLEQTERAFRHFVTPRRMWREPAG